MSAHRPQKDPSPTPRQAPESHPSPSKSPRSKVKACLGVPHIAPKRPFAKSKACPSVAWKTPWRGHDMPSCRTQGHVIPAHCPQKGLGPRQGMTQSPAHHPQKGPCPRLGTPPSPAHCPKKSHTLRPRHGLESRTSPPKGPGLRLTHAPTRSPPKVTGRL